ncbi:MAG: HAD family hydrolase [Clostridia bacterium]|nr:HAD family hydrolase [Clostridia bacterium]
MAVKAVLFDLDGTLLPMDQDIFVKAYFKGLSTALTSRGYDPKELVGAVWQGTEAMIHNDGSDTNEQVFWKSFCSTYGEKAKEDIPHFDRFYQQEFDRVQSVCGNHPMAKKTVSYLKEKGILTVLATNPIFPSVATEKRMRWAGLSPEDFCLYTTYENCRYSKPNLNYYRDILDKLQLSPEECVMVGNDVADDMVVTELGMRVFLLTDCLINHENRDISNYPSGSWDELFVYLTSHIKQD